MLKDLQIPPHMRLVAVSKGRSSYEIEYLISQGVVWFGENRTEEVLKKWPSLKEKYPHVKLQFIGRLQSNKVKEVVKYCDSIVSLDRPSLIEGLATALIHIPKKRELLIQVNLAKETQKGGVGEEGLESLLTQAKEKGLSIQGLMTMPPLLGDPTPFFRRLKELCTTYHLKECSMGMSDDYLIAIKEGATQVRIGRALF